MSRRSRTALLIVDMLNRLDFPGAQSLLKPARDAARRIARLKKRAISRGVPVVYVNDNFGHWHSDWARVYDLCSRLDSNGREIALLLKPAKSDYFVLKPRHSGFHSTCLNLLLRELGTESLILTGIATDICVYFTAYDAYLHDYRLIVPSDCVAAESGRANAGALRAMKKLFKAHSPESASLRL